MTRERASVARELHDAVAHNVSVIAIQAGGAEPLVDRDPARAAQCLELIEQVAREALAELGRLGAAAPQDSPRPGLARVGVLAERARAAGLAVDLDVAEPDEDLPAGVDLAAFRVVQEALANTAKHARAAHAWVTVRCDAARGRARDRRRRPRPGPLPQERRRHHRPRPRRHARARRALRRHARDRPARAGPRLPRPRHDPHRRLMAIRVLIADDQSLVRAGFRLVLENHDDIEVVGEASNGHEAVHGTGRLQPDVVLMDIRMPELDGIAATAEITARHPARVLVLTTYDLDEYVYDALQAGASGFLLKDTPPEQLAGGIRAVAAGEALLAPTVTRRLIEEFARVGPASRARPAELDELTPRELEVLRLLARGMSNAEIAAQFVLGETTVKTHVAHVLNKLGLRDRVQAVVLAYESGLVVAGPGGGVAPANVNGTGGCPERPGAHRCVLRLPPCGATRTSRPRSRSRQRSGCPSPIAIRSRSRRRRRSSASAVRRPISPVRHVPHSPQRAFTSIAPSSSSKRSIVLTAFERHIGQIRKRIPRPSPGRRAAASQPACVRRSWPHPPRAHTTSVAGIRPSSAAASSAAKSSALRSA